MCAAVCALLLLFHADAMAAAREGFEIFQSSVFPALLPFFVCASIMQETGVVNAQNRMGLLLMSYISGAPSGARLISGVDVDDQTRSILAAALNMLSPMFMIGAFANNMLGNKWLALPMLIGQVTSGIAILLFIRLPKGKKSLPAVAGPSIPDAIKSAMMSMLMICGTIMIFMVLITLLNDIGILDIIAYPFDKLLGLFNVREGMFKLVLAGSIEVVNGCNMIKDAQITMRQAVVLGTFITTFGGLCIMAQSSLFFKIKAWHYIVIKLMQSIVASTIAYLLFPLFAKDTLPVFNPVTGERMIENTMSMGFAFLSSLLGMSVIFLFSMARKRLNR